MTKIIDCACKHEFQDRNYGPGKRVANSIKCEPGQNYYRCTVCGRIDQQAQQKKES